MCANPRLIFIGPLGPFMPIIPNRIRYIVTCRINTRRADRLLGKMKTSNLISRLIIPKVQISICSAGKQKFIVSRVKSDGINGVHHLGFRLVITGLNIGLVTLKSHNLFNFVFLIVIQGQI